MNAFAPMLEQRTEIEITKPEDFLPSVQRLRARGLEVALRFPKGCMLRRACGGTPWVAWFPRDAESADWRIDPKGHLQCAAFAEARWRGKKGRRRTPKAETPFRWLPGRRTRIVLVGGQ